jgi:hypothetical protein
MEITEGQKYERAGAVHFVEDAGADWVEVTRQGRDPALVERARFEEEVARGEAVLHPRCAACGLPVDPAESPDGERHRGCVFQEGSARLRCELMADGHGAEAAVASELLADGDPLGAALELAGDHSRPWAERQAAERVASGLVPASELVEAQAECPSCGQAEQFWPREAEEGHYCIACGERVA